MEDTVQPDEILSMQPGTNNNIVRIDIDDWARLQEQMERQADLLKRQHKALADLDKIFDFTDALAPGEFDIEDTAFANEAFEKARAVLAESEEALKGGDST